MTDRGYGYVKCPDFRQDVQVTFETVGGGNLVEGKPVQFQIDPTNHHLRAMTIKGAGVNKLWYDGEGNMVDWNIAFDREMRRIKYLENCPTHLKAENTFLDTSYLTNPEDSEVAYNKMMSGRQAKEALLRSKLPYGMKLHPDTLVPIVDNKVMLQRKLKKALRQSRDNFNNSIASNKAKSNR